MSASNVDLVKAGYEAFGSGDMDAVMQLLQDTEWHEAAGTPWGGVSQGSEAILTNVFGPIMQQITDFKATPKELMPAGDNCVLSVGNYTGKGPGGDLDARFAHLWRFTDGKCTHFEQFADSALMRDVVG